MKKNGNRFLSMLIIFLCSLFITVTQSFKQDKNETVFNDTTGKNWFPYFDFDAAEFKNPSREFGPFTRWWWPGNDVTNEELKREIKLFADNGFAGIEIQPLTMGINPNAPQERLNKVYSWDSPSFYEHVKAVMEQAKKNGITVDMNGGSGWPLGGPQVAPQESMLTLTYCDTIVAGGETININVPKNLPDYSKLVIFDDYHLYNFIDPALAKLQSVIAAKIIKKDATQIFLDQQSVFNITGNVADNKINFKTPPGGEWAIIALWAMPDGQIPTLIASKNPGFVANHFDSVLVQKNYDHLFGATTGLRQYYSKPFRAVFNDSYEFRTDRHYAYNFLSFFKQQRGYDITPFVAANLQKGYNNNAAALLFPDAKPPFVFSKEDWRLQYDYDVTVGELLQSQFIQSSNNWMQARGLLHRTQAYGIKTDVIASGGSAAIPEAEQLFAKGSEGFIKLVTSGAHLYNRPVITQESFVFLARSEMTTPQKLKTLSDKAFTCGINQIIYSGTSYKYHTDDYGKEGWNTWSSPYSGFDFSSNENESFAYWKYIKDINLYITRAQYALRSGKPHSDVLIYFPFADFTQEDLLQNPQEILANGYFKGVEPAMGEGNEQSVNNLTEKQKWFTEVWKTVNALNEKGITWDWANDASLKTALLQNGNIAIRGNQYQALLLVNAPYIQLTSAVQINMLVQQGAKLLIVGNAPAMQPGYLNYAANDSKTKQLIQDCMQQTNSKQVTDSIELYAWINNLPKHIKFNSSYNFTRTVEREMKDGSILRFIWNQSDQWQTVSLKVDAAYKNNYWLNPADGSVAKAANVSLDNNSFTYLLPPYGSVIFYAAKKELAAATLDAAASAPNNANEILRIEKWNIKAGSAEKKNSNLFEWRTDDAFKYQSSQGIYIANFDLNKASHKNYFVNLGTVYFTAEVKVNGQVAGNKIWSPYILNITSFLKTGKNSIEIKVTPTQRNEFIYQANGGNKKYAQFKNKESTLMPAGLIGPVVIVTD